MQKAGDNKKRQPQQANRNLRQNYDYLYFIRLVSFFLSSLSPNDD